MDINADDFDESVEALYSDREVSLGINSLGIS